MSEKYRMLYSGIRSGRTYKAAMNLAEIARKHTSIEITVVSEEVKELKARIELLEAVRDAAEVYLLSGAPDYPAKFERLSAALKAARSGE